MSYLYCHIHFRPIPRVGSRSCLSWSHAGARVRTRSGGSPSFDSSITSSVILILLIHVRRFIYEKITAMLSTRVSAKNLNVLYLFIQLTCISTVCSFIFYPVSSFEIKEGNNLQFFLCQLSHLHFRFYWSENVRIWIRGKVLYPDLQLLVGHTHPRSVF